jgi:hypothetical protein
MLVDEVLAHRFGPASGVRVTLCWATIEPFMIKRRPVQKEYGPRSVTGRYRLTALWAAQAAGSSPVSVSRVPEPLLEPHHLCMAYSEPFRLR